MTELRNLRVIARGPFRIAESPVWDPERQCLWWVDILGRSLWRWREGAELWQHGFDAPLGSLGLTDDGRLVLAAGRSLRLFDPGSGREEILVEQLDEPATNRLNDGKVGPDGAFWVGSMDDRPVRQPLGSLWRVTGDGQAERKLAGVTISNGLAFSADGRTLIHSDSRGPWIDRWDLEPASGSLSNRRRIAEPGEAEGRPDGGAFDIAGCYWSAGVTAGCLNRWDLEGRLLEKHRLPMARPTMPCFGGPDGRTLFVTSLTDGLPPEARAPDGLDGAVIAFDTDLAGVAPFRFRCRRLTRG